MEEILYIVWVDILALYGAGYFLASVFLFFYRLNAPWEFGKFRDAVIGQPRNWFTTGLVWAYRFYIVWPYTYWQFIIPGKKFPKEENEESS